MLEIITRRTEDTINLIWDTLKWLRFTIFCKNDNTMVYLKNLEEFLDITVMNGMCRCYLFHTDDTEDGKQF